MKQLIEGNRKNEMIEDDLSLWEPMNAMHDILKS